MGKTSRLWFKDGTYMDVPSENAWEYESQSDWSRTETLRDDDVDSAERDARVR